MANLKVSADIQLCKTLSSGNLCLQTDSPEEMHGWIRDIEMKIQEFRGPPKVTLITASPLDTKTKYVYYLFMFLASDKCSE